MFFAESHLDPSVSPHGVCTLLKRKKLILLVEFAHRDLKTYQVLEIRKRKFRGISKTLHFQLRIGKVLFQRGVFIHFNYNYNFSDNYKEYYSKKYGSKFI